MFPAAEFELRKFLLALIFLGMGGLSAELLLIEHTESFTQWIPLGCLGAGLATTLAFALRPARATLKVFRIVMVAFAVAGALGVYYHYAGNVEFALERSSELRGFGLIWEALTGATPALAPGALAQIGLLGLVYAYGHPQSEKQ